MNLLDDDLKTPIMNAAEMGNMGVIKLLVKLGSPLDGKVAMANCFILSNQTG